MVKRKQAGNSASESLQKRLRQTHTSLVTLRDLSDELSLHCLALLPYDDLLRVSEVSKHLNRLANDDQLWRRLFLRRFGNRQQPGTPTLLSSPLFRPSQRHRTWKELYKVSYNWTTGNARSTQLSLRSSVLPDLPRTFCMEEDDTLGDDAYDSLFERVPFQAEQQSTGHKSLAGGSGSSNTHVVWHGQFYFVANRQPSTHSAVPKVSVHVSSSSSSSSSSASSSSKCLDQIVSVGLEALHPSKPIGIAEMRLDDLPYSKETGIRLAVFYTSGQYSLFRLENLHYFATSPFKYREEYFSSSLSSNPTVLARFYSPLLVTSGSDCSIRFRLLEHRKQDGKNSAEELVVTHSQPTMRSHICFAPMTMRLEHTTPSALSGSSLSSAPQDFRVSLAYSTPYYPATFTVGVQIFDLHIPNHSASDMTYSSVRARGQKLDVLARNALAVPLVMSPLSTGSSTSPSLQSQAVVTSIEHDGPYIVTSKSDNTISVYEVIDYLQQHLHSQVRSFPCESQRRQNSSPVKTAYIPALQLRHVRTLFGHTAAVDAVSVLDGRCVSTGRDGVKLWELPQASQLPGVALDDARRSVHLEEEDIRQANVRIRQRDEPQVAEDGLQASSHMEPEGRCKWLGLDGSKIVTVLSTQGGQSEAIRVYDFE